MIKIINEIDKSYKGKVEILISYQVNVNHEQPELFNGYHGELDLYKDLIIGEKLNKRKVLPELKFNYPDGKLYAVYRYHLGKYLSKSNLNKLAKYTEKSIQDKSIIVEFGNTKYDINLSCKDTMFVKQTALESPIGYLFLDDMLQDDKDHVAYMQFLNNKPSFDRLVKLCKKLHLKTDDTMITGIMLPIHKKHESTGTLLVHESVQKYFLMYNLSQNYINGFEEGSNEYQVGVAMLYDVKFNDYVLRCAIKQAKENKSPDPDNFTNQFNAAVKRIQKIKI